MYYLLYIYREVHQREEKLPQKKPSMSLGRQSLYHVHLLTITVDQVRQNEFKKIKTKQIKI
jgi:hypothetical protein